MPPYLDSPTTHTRLPERYHALLEVARSLTGTLRPTELYRAIHRETGKILDIDGFYVSLYDPAGGDATVVFWAEAGVQQDASVSYRGIDSEVIRTGRPVLVEDGIHDSSLLTLGVPGSPPTRSAISAPIRHKGRVVGVLSSQSGRPGAYSSEDLQLLEAIADIAGIAIANARHVDALERSRAQAERIEQIGRAITSTLDRRVVMTKVIDAVIDLIDADRASVWRVERGEAHCHASAGANPLRPDTRWALDGTAHDVLVTQREMLVIDQASSTDLLTESGRACFPEGFVVGAPLFADDRVFGFLTATRATGRPGDSADVALLRQLAAQASIALENAQLHATVQELSLTDPLTSLPNRRHLEMHLAREVAAAVRGRKVVAVIFDLDNFKQYNDRFGHMEGDQALRAVSGILADMSRTMNLVGRWGGDEFVSILSDTDLEGARVYAERTADRVREELLPEGISISYGMALFDPDAMAQPGELIRTADEALYEAKAARDNAK